MVETLFSPPHNASEDEYLLMRQSASTKPRQDWVRDEEAQSHDVRWIAIHDLYDLRRDKAGKANALKQIKDHETVIELTSVDVFSREELERMMRESEA